MAGPIEAKDEFMSYDRWKNSILGSTNQKNELEKILLSRYPKHTKSWKYKQMIMQDPDLMNLLSDERKAEIIQLNKEMESELVVNKKHLISKLKESAAYINDDNSYTYCIWDLENFIFNVLGSDANEFIEYTGSNEYTVKIKFKEDE